MIASYLADILDIVEMLLPFYGHWLETLLKLVIQLTIILIFFVVSPV